MSYDERKLCVVCAWRGTCNLKYSMPGGVALHCMEFTRDVSLKEPEEEIRKRNILVIGAREIGKTTLVRKVVEQAGLIAEGYYTRAVKEGWFGGRRQELVFFTGGVMTLATSKTHRGWARLGYARVNLEGIERDLIPRLQRAVLSERTQVIVFDEVSQRECLSEMFRRQVVDCITSRKSVLATVTVGEQDDEFLHALEARSDVNVIHIGYDNRASLAHRLVPMLTGQSEHPSRTATAF